MLQENDQNLHEADIYNYGDCDSKYYREIHRNDKPDFKKSEKFINNVSLLVYLEW